MMKATALILLTAASASAFRAPHFIGRIRTTLNDSTERYSQTDVLDVDRAKFCEEHFGECTLEEIQELKDGEKTEQTNENRCVV